MLPWPVWPLAGHARLGQKTVVGFMTILLLALRGSVPSSVCLDPRFCSKRTSPRFSVELPHAADDVGKQVQWGTPHQFRCKLGRRQVIVQKRTTATMERIATAADPGSAQPLREAISRGELIQVIRLLSS